jgi:RNA-binding protein YhbY
MTAREYQPTFQIGKNGATEGTIRLLETAFKTREQVKIVLLKSAGHTKEKTDEVGKFIVDKLGKNYTYKSLGFTLFIRKWRKDKR